MQEVVKMYAAASEMLLKNPLYSIITQTIYRNAKSPQAMQMTSKTQQAICVSSQWFKFIQATAKSSYALDHWCIRVLC